MFGTIDVPASIDMEPLHLKLDPIKGAVAYHRSLADDVVDKKILMKRKKSFFVNPVEPTSTPASICTHVLLDLEQPVVIEPQSDCSVHLTFPLEIGVFVAGRKTRKLIDVFSLTPQKYTLYGQPTGGLICRYWRSGVHMSLPEAEKTKEGILDLNIVNDTVNWCQITKTVFSAYHMKLFFNDEMVFMKGRMKVVDTITAETRIEKTSNRAGMKSSVEIHSLSKLSIATSAFTMEHGL